MAYIYSAIGVKKFLDYNGLVHFAQKLNDYPTNEVLAAVVEGVQDALDEKMDSIKVKTTAEWSAMHGFAPAAGEIIVYTDKAVITEDNTTVNIPGIKIGDGNAYVNDLPFVADDIVQLVANHVNDPVVHITAAERTFWNNKLNCAVSDETLSFNRL